jgi:hypothetical protein
MKTLLKYSQKQLLTKNLSKSFATAAPADKTAKQGSSISKRFHDIYLQEMEKLKNNT